MTMFARILVAALLAALASTALDAISVGGLPAHLALGFIVFIVLFTHIDR